jgi:hypothetical protein
LKEVPPSGEAVSAIDKGEDCFAAHQSWFLKYLLHLAKTARS